MFVNIRIKHVLHTLRIYTYFFHDIKDLNSIKCGKHNDKTRNTNISFFRSVRLCIYVLYSIHNAV